MNVREVLIRGNYIITIPDKGMVIPYHINGLTRKEINKRFYGFVRNLKNKGHKVWYGKPMVNREPVTDLQTGLSIENAYGLTTTIYVNPIIHNITTNEPLILR